MGKNILIFSSDYKPGGGGIAEHTFQIANALGKLGCRVSVLARGKAEQEGFDRSRGFATYRYPSFPVLGDIIAFFYLIFLCRSRKIDILYCATTHPSGETAFFASLFLRVKTCVVVHGYEVAYCGRGLRAFLKTALRPIRSFVYNNFSLIIAVSDFTKDQLISSGVNKKRIKVINNGVDTKGWLNFPVDHELLRGYGLNGKKVILTVGALIKRKNHAMVLNALAKIKDVVPDFKYFVAGDGPCKDELRRETERFGLSDSVLILGRVNDDLLRALYFACDVFVMPSSQFGSSVEGFGIAFLEAGICGKPSIAGRIGGGASAIIDGHTGFLVNPNDLNELSAKIQKLLLDQDLSRRLGENARKLIIERFDWSKIAGSLKEQLDAITR